MEAGPIPHDLTQYEPEDRRQFDAARAALGKLATDGQRRARLYEMLTGGKLSARDGAVLAMQHIGSGRAPEPPPRA